MLQSALLQLILKHLNLQLQELLVHHDLLLL